MASVSFEGRCQPFSLSCRPCLASIIRLLVVLEAYVAHLGSPSGCMLFHLHLMVELPSCVCILSSKAASASNATKYGAEAGGYLIFICTTSIWRPDRRVTHNSRHPESPALREALSSAIVPGCSCTVHPLVSGTYYVGTR